MLRRVNVETNARAPFPTCRRDVSKLLPLCRGNSAAARKKDRLSANGCTKSYVTSSFTIRRRMSSLENGELQISFFLCIARRHWHTDVKHSPDISVLLIKTARKIRINVNIYIYAEISSFLVVQFFFPFSKIFIEEKSTFSAIVCITYLLTR